MDYLKIYKQFVSFPELSLVENVVDNDRHKIVLIQNEGSVKNGIKQLESSVPDDIYGFDIEGSQKWESVKIKFQIRINIQNQQEYEKLSKKEKKRYNMKNTTLKINFYEKRRSQLELVQISSYNITIIFQLEFKKLLKNDSFTQFLKNERNKFIIWNQWTEKQQEKTDDNILKQYGECLKTMFNKNYIQINSENLSCKKIPRMVLCVNDRKTYIQECQEYMKKSEFKSRIYNKPLKKEVIYYSVFDSLTQLIGYQILNDKYSTRMIFKDNTLINSFELFNNYYIEQLIQKIFENIEKDSIKR